MSLRIRQLTNSANAIILAFLQQGQFPAVSAVIQALYRRLAKAGHPRTHFRHLHRDARTAPKALTRLGVEILTDLTDLYAEAMNQVNRVVRAFDHQQTWRVRLTQRMTELDAELSALESGAMVHCGQLSSYQQIDLDRTTCFLDFQTNSAQLPPASNRLAKVELTHAHITTSAIHRTHTGTIHSILNDLTNDLYFVRVHKTGTLTLTVKLKKPRSMSKVVLRGIRDSGLTARLVVGGQDLTTQAFGLAAAVEWDFPARSVHELVLHLHKALPDKIQGTKQFYDFGISSLGCYTEHYQHTGELVTTPIPFPRTIGTLRLDTTQSVPPGCAIDWGFSLDGGAFSPLTPGQAVILTPSQPLTRKRVFPLLSVRASAIVYPLNDDGSTQATRVDRGLAVVAPLRGGRTPLFTLCTLNPGVEALTVLRGRNAWKVRSYHYSPIQSGVITDPPPTLRDFQNLRGTGSPQDSLPAVFGRYQPLEWDADTQFPGLTSAERQALRLPAIEYPTSTLNDRVMTLFEATITVNRLLAPSILASLRATTITLPAAFGAGRAALYLNGRRVPIVTTTTNAALNYTASLDLGPGPNALQLVTNVYASLGGGALDLGTEVFRQLCGAGGYATWYADPGPMSEVSLYELQYQTARNDFSRFAVTQNPTKPGEIVVVRELPTCYYDLVGNGVPQTTSPLWGTIGVAVVLHASLQGNPANPSTTPRINGYTLTIVE